jgi:hypothetical protein
VLVLEFNAAARVVTVYVGDDALTDQFEAGTPPLIEDGDDADE